MIPEGPNTLSETMIFSASLSVSTCRCQGAVVTYSTAYALIGALTVMVCVGAGSMWRMTLLAGSPPIEISSLTGNRAAPHLFCMCVTSYSPQDGRVHLSTYRRLPRTTDGRNPRHVPTTHLTV